MSLTFIKCINCSTSFLKCLALESAINNTWRLIGGGSHPLILLLSSPLILILNLQVPQDFSHAVLVTWFRECCFVLNFSKRDSCSPYTMPHSHVTYCSLNHASSPNNALKHYAAFKGFISEKAVFCNISAFTSHLQWCTIRMLHPNEPN